MIVHKFTQAQRDERMASLSDVQRDFLENKLKRGRRTAFANFMQDEKVTAIRSADGIELADEETSVKDWEIVDFQDFGPNNRAGQCACGISLRYQFTVAHQLTKKRIHYGKHHLGTFLNLEVKEIDALLGKIDKIDTELDELLLRIEKNQYGYEFYEQLQDKDEVPRTITAHMDAQVPFTHRQIMRLEKLLIKQLTALSERLVQEQLDEGMRERKRIMALQQELHEASRQRRLDQQVAAHEQQQARKTEIASVIEETKSQLQATSSVEEIAYALVCKGLSSAVEISTVMVENFNVDRRLSKGLYERPYIYFDVLCALDRQVALGNLVKDEGSTIVDCYYYVADGDMVQMPIHEEDEDDLFGEGYQQTLF